MQGGLGVGVWEKGRQGVRHHLAPHGAASRNDGCCGQHLEAAPIAGAAEQNLVRACACAARACAACACRTPAALASHHRFGSVNMNIRTRPPGWLRCRIRLAAVAGTRSRRAPAGPPQSSPMCCSAKSGSAVDRVRSAAPSPLPFSSPPPRRQCAYHSATSRPALVARWCTRQLNMITHGARARPAVNPRPQATWSTQLAASRRRPGYKTT